MPQLLVTMVFSDALVSAEYKLQQLTGKQGNTLDTYEQSLGKPSESDCAFVAKILIKTDLPLSGIETDKGIQHALTA